MEILGMMFTIAGGVTMIIGGIWLLIITFTEGGIFWGLGCLLFSPISLIFIITHWYESKKPVLVQFSGVGLMLIGLLLGG